MSRKIYDNVKNAEHVSTVLSRLRQAVEEQDVERSLKELHALSECTIFSNHKPTYDSWNEMRQPLLVFLFESLPFERFLEIPLSEYIVSEYDLAEATGGRVAPEQAMRLLEHFGEPLPEWLNPLRGTGEEISLRLERLILQKLEQPLSYPEVTSLCELVSELVRRGDSTAAEATERFLLHPPWTDERLTKAIWLGLSRLFSERGKALLQQAIRERPDDLDLLKAYSACDPAGATAMVLDALAEAKGDREELFRWLLWQPEWPSRPPGQLEESFRRWSSLERAYFQKIVELRAPGWQLSSLATKWGRFQLAALQILGYLRFPVLALGGLLLITIPVYFWLYQPLLTYLVGAPTRWLSLPSAAALLWTVSSWITSAPDFNPGMEGLQELQLKAYLQLTATLFLLAAPLLQRL